MGKRKGGECMRWEKRERRGSEASEEVEKGEG